MPRPKSTKKPEVLDYRHKDAKRKNNPEEGLATYLPEEHSSKKYQYDPHLDPQIVWAGKAEHTSFEVPVVPLHIHERITPKSIISILEKKREHQLRLFDEGEYPLEKRVDFYKHEMDWANRLILGDSLLVMNSLLTKELMGGKVQMIYLDPPYGIKFSSNFQPRIDQRDVRADDMHLTREPEQIKAYRDTWMLGIHSYLTYLRDRILLCRELLAESGSIFIQISDENLHHVRELMDEIFGADNFCSVITFRKTAAVSSPMARLNVLGTICDYLLWYAKSKEHIKYRQLFLSKDIGTEASEQYQYVELPNGTRRRPTPEEANNPKLLKNTRLFQATSLQSAGYSETLAQTFEFEGKLYKPNPNRHWSTTIDGLRRLVAANRIIATGNTLRYVRYLEDFPVLPLTNIWNDLMGASDLVYVVQTNTKVIERCLLMTTDPGDLVFDLTCGSGTAAYCAEQWGRRWITCDTSRVALAIARQRLLTAVFPYYQLFQPQEGVRSGFVYKTVPHVTLKSIAQNELPERETLYDSPNVDTSAIRVSGPYTVEAIPPPTLDASVTSQKPEVIVAAEEYISVLIEAIRKSGIVFPGGKMLKLQNLTPITSTGFLHAEAITSNGEAHRVAISFGPRYGPLGVRQAEEAIRTATVNGYAMLVLAGFSIDPATQAFVQKTPLKLQVQFAYINPDMEIHDLLKQTQGSQLFTAFGEPDIEVIQDKSGKCLVRLLGVDIYDPTTGKTEQTSVDDIPAWFLDEDYDGYSFNICQAFFADGAASKNPWDKLENALRGIVDKEKIEHFRGTASLPFELGKHKTIAVKVLDNRGNEVIKIRELDGTRG